MSQVVAQRAPAARNWVEIDIAILVRCRRHQLSRQASETLAERLVAAYAKRGVYVEAQDAAYGMLCFVVVAPPWSVARPLVRTARRIAHEFVRRNPRLAGRRVERIAAWTTPRRAEHAAARGLPALSSAPAR